MTTEPGFTLTIVVAGHEIHVKTSAEVARRNVTNAMTRPMSSLAGHDPSELDTRADLHQALSVLAADVLLRGVEKIREFQDIDGRWWLFRGELVSAVAVADDAGTACGSLGFELRSPE